MEATTIYQALESTIPVKPCCKPVPAQSGIRLAILRANAIVDAWGPNLRVIRSRMDVHAAAECGYRVNLLGHVGRVTAVLAESANRAVVYLTDGAVIRPIRVQFGRRAA